MIHSFADQLFAGQFRRNSTLLLFSSLIPLREIDCKRENVIIFAVINVTDEISLAMVDGERKLISQSMKVLFLSSSVEATFSLRPRRKFTIAVSQRGSGQITFIFSSLRIRLLSVCGCMCHFLSSSRVILLQPIYFQVMLSFFFSLTTRGQ